MNHKRLTMLRDIEQLRIHDVKLAAAPIMTQVINVAEAEEEWSIKGPIPGPPGNRDERTVLALHATVCRKKTTSKSGNFNGRILKSSIFPVFLGDGNAPSPAPPVMRKFIFPVVLRGQRLRRVRRRVRGPFSRRRASDWQIGKPFRETPLP